MPWGVMSLPQGLQLPPDCVLLPSQDNQAARRAQASLLQLARTSSTAVNGNLIRELTGRRLGLRKKLGQACLVTKYGLDCQLAGHCKGINSVQFARLGEREVVVTSSDDLKVILWGLGQRQKVLQVNTDHEIVMTQARLLEHAQLVTACCDGQVRMTSVGEEGRRGDSRLVVQHRGAVYKVAPVTFSPELLLSGGEDGQVFCVDLRVREPTKLLALRDRRDRKVQVYSLQSSPADPTQFCLTGRDPLLRIFDMRQLGCGEAVSCLAPPGLAKEWVETNPNEAQYSPNGQEVIVSYDFLRHTDKNIYLFSSSTPSGGLPSQVFKSYRDSPALSWLGNEIVLSGSNTAYAGLTSGDIFFWDRDTGGVLHCLQGDSHGIVRGLESHPRLPLLASCGVDTNLKLWTLQPDTKH